MKKAIVIFMISMFFGSMSYSQNETMFVIHTDYGDITGMLYNETPGHRDNFIKLVNEGWYDGSIFHRVINEFMIQGGGNKDGRNDPGYTIPAEFVPELYHKKGALAAARMSDQVNPQKRSSGSQFYIVQGRTFSASDVEAMAKRKASLGCDWTEEQKKTYQTIGGTPHLDCDYTVFGQIIDGLDVVDKIAAVQTGQRDKPVKDVTMTIEILD